MKAFFYLRWWIIKIISRFVLFFIKNIFPSTFHIIEGKYLQLCPKPITQALQKAGHKFLDVKACVCVCVHCSVVTHQYLYCHNFLVKQPPGVWQGQKAAKSTPRSCLAWNNRVLRAAWHTTSRVIHTLFCIIQKGKKWWMLTDWKEMEVSECSFKWNVLT